MKKKLLQLASLVGAFWSNECLKANLVTNFSLAHESYLWNSSKYLAANYQSPKDPKSFMLSTGVGVEVGFDPEGRDKDNNKVDVYQIYSKSSNIVPLAVDWGTLSADAQSLLIALTNTPQLFDPGADLSNKSLQVNFTPKTDIKEWDVTPWVKVALPLESIDGQVELSVNLPIKFIDAQTKWNAESASVVSNGPNPGALQEISTSELLDVINSGKKNINTKSFNENGIGDISVLLSWKNHYTQVNDSLSSVGLFVQTGLILPTGKKSDLNKMLSFPFGYDGSAGIPVSGMVNLNFAKNFRVGAAGNVTFFFSESSDRYLKTNVNEGSYFLANHMTATRSPGIALGFNALAEAISSCKKYSAGIMYSYKKNYEDTISYEANSIVVNGSGSGMDAAIKSMEEFKERSIHSIIARAGVDFKEVVESDFAPTLSLSLELPIKAERKMVFKILKLEASMNF